MKSNFVSLTLMLGVVMVGQAQQKEATHLNAAQFSQKMRQTPVRTILDVRTPAEVAQGTLPGAIVLDYYAPDFNKRLARLDHTKPVFVYCSMGGRSSKAMQQMQLAGFRTVFNLLGGMQAWQQGGYPVFRLSP